MLRVLILTLLFVVSAHAFGDPVPQEELSLLLVPGFGKVTLQADQVELTGSITLKGESEEGLLREMDRRLATIADTLSVLDSSRVELRLGELTTGEWKAFSESGPRIQKSVSVFVPDLSVLDRITATLYGQGWTGGSAWTSTQEARAREEAYETACRDARAKAELLAKELKVKIEGVHRIYVDGLARRTTGYRYGRANPERPSFQLTDEGLMYARGARATELSTQEVEFSKQITVEFLIH